MNPIDNAPHDEMRAWRHDIHKHPELGFAEARTAAKVAGLLEGFGLEVHPGIGTTGVVGVLRRGGSNRAIGLRADGLPPFHVPIAMLVLAR